MSYQVYTESQLYIEYGYLMDKDHGRDTELLVDILKETGLNFKRIGKLFFLENKNE